MARASFSSALLVLALAACATPVPATDAGVLADGAPTATLQIVATDRASLTGVAGDVIPLSVAWVGVDGAHSPVDATATVTWSGPPVVTALPAGSMPSESNLPATGAAPTAFFLVNTEHYRASDLAGMLFVIDAGSASGGSIAVHATITGAGPDTSLDATIPIGPAPAGDSTRGSTYYAENCASCHGARAEGGEAPPLDVTDGVAGDPDWNAALFASVTRGDVDDMGVSEGAAMPRWLVIPTPSGVPLTTQEMIDVYAWLGTQH
jgi:mono/diheme cytochrome c family protein